jgi:hypothetical protein
MTTVLDRSYLIAAGIFGVGLLVLILVMQDLGGRLPDLPRPESAASPAGMGPTNSRVRDLFLPAAIGRVKPATNLPPPFVTTFFQPPSPPPSANAKHTRKVSISYDGFFQTNAGEKRAYVRVGGAMTLLSPGAPVVSDLMISNIDRLTLTLKRGSTQDVVVPFRGSTEVEIPVE